MTDTIFLGGSIAALMALAAVLWLIGRAAADCPELRQAARVATLAVTTGFVAIGAGIVGIIGGAMPFAELGEPRGLYLALGLVAVALGIGFYYAASTLGDILREPGPPTGAAQAETPASGAAAA